MVRAGDITHELGGQELNGDDVSMTNSTRSAKFTLELDPGERAELTMLLERELRDVHVEARRTEAPDYQKGIHDHEAVLRRLMERLRAG